MSYRCQFDRAAAVAGAALTLVAPALAQPATPAAAAAYAAPNYTQAATWLCRPGRADACAAPLATTAVAANGSTSVGGIAAATAPATDCFYVYPTVSTDPTGNSDMVQDRAETSVAVAQFAAFRSVCRTFAPLYRQVTLAALRDAMLGRPTTADRTMGYRDVSAAWADYLARDNSGRGVVLIGHSQGSAVLKALIQNEIEGKPIAGRIIAAYLLGTNVLVPAGKAVGGDFKTMPVCTTAMATGCVVTYVSFRDGAAPPANSRFGRTEAAGMEVACTNPAAIAGGRGALKPMLPTSSAIVDNAAVQAEWATGVTVATPFVALPGLLSAECVRAAGAHVLAIRTDADSADPRTDRINGDVVVGGQVLPDWGLHLVDVNAAMGNLTDLAATQSAAWVKARR
jgi:hypothetical protein